MNEPTNLPRTVPRYGSAFPRRNCVTEWTPTEKAIADAVDAVERAGASVHLTDAVILLTKAQAKVADHVEGLPEPARPVLDAGGRSDQGQVICTHCDEVIGYTTYEERAKVWVELLAHERVCPKNPLAIELAQIQMAFGNPAALDSCPTLAEKAAKCVSMLAYMNAPAAPPADRQPPEEEPTVEIDALVVQAKTNWCSFSHGHGMDSKQIAAIDMLASLARKAHPAPVPVERPTVDDKRVSVLLRNAAALLESAEYDEAGDEQERVRLLTALPQEAERFYPLEQSLADMGFPSRANGTYPAPVERGEETI